MTTQKNRELVYLALIAVILILKFTASLSTGLFEDEAIYWNWSQSLDASYSLTTIALIKLFTFLFSSSGELVVRLPALLSNLVIIYFVFKTGKLLNAEKDMIFVSIITFLSIPFVTIYSAFISPDTFLLTFCVASIYYMIKAVKSDKIGDWILSGLFTGLMILSKYTAALFLLAAGISLLLIYRKIPKNTLWLFVTAALTALPLIVWNVINEPVWFKYYLLTDADKINAGFFETIFTLLMSQISILMPMGFILMLTLIVLIYSKKSELPEIRLLKFLSLIMCLIYLGFSLTGKIKGNWFFITYIPLLLFFVTVEFRKYLKVIACSVVAFNFILLAVINLPADKIELLSQNKAAELIDRSFSFYWPDHGKRENNDYSWSDRIIKMKNWKEAVKNIESNILTSGEKYDFIASDDFTLCPILEYYFKDRDDIYLIGDLRFKYINSAESFKDLKGKDALIVTYQNSSFKNLQSKFAYLKNVEDVKIKLTDNINKDFRIIHGMRFLPEYTTKLK